MKKIIVTKITGEVIHNTELPSQEWLDREIRLNSWGKPARWLPDFLEGVETRQILVHEATLEGMEVIGEVETYIPAQEAVYITEYLHPAEYSYQIIEEDLAVIKARKIAELNDISLKNNEYICGEKAYRAINIAMGKYLAEGKKTKEDGYKADFVARSAQLTTELDRCVALVNAATTEKEINNIEFSLQ